MTALMPCWEEGELLRILKPDAEEIDDHVFRAVHCPTELQVTDSASGALMPKSPDTLVRDFLDPLRDYVQMAVIGESGTGKSHLIQWLRLHIPRDDATVLLTIPRTGTSLRGIIERIIAQLPPDERSPYEERLKTAGNHAMTQAAKVSRFLNELAHAIEHSNICTDPIDKDLATVLPSVFLDPNLRAEFFAKPGGTTDLIVQHIFSDPTSRDQDEQRRDFRLGDLPLDGQSYLKAAFLSKEAIDFIKGESGMELRAIGLMNAHRNIAIAQTLNFSADHLIELMNALRRHLEGQGKRLILLIEDFARVQGIDTALLQALITPPSQGEDRLCELRWAMAVTTGPYKLLDATVRTRTTIVVDMDRSKPTSLQRLTAGYLNALRIGMRRLEELPATETPASRCGACPHKTKCLPAFGEVDDIGLFPFTTTAIDNMARRTGSLNSDGSFNARRYMRSVLEAVLKHHYSDLVQGEFPSGALLGRIKGQGVLSPAQKQVLEQRDAGLSERRIALLELWNGKEEIVNLDAWIHEAFGLPPLSGVTTSLSEDAEKVSPGEKAGREERRLAPHVATVRKWANGELVLPQTVATELRGLIYAAVESHIDWDMLGIERTAVAHPTSPKAAFRQTSINFESQQTQRGKTMVALEIFRSSAVVLEALLAFKHYQSWNFPDGMQLLTNLMESLEEWSAEVKKQLIGLFGPQKGWHPVAATAELLALAHIVCGRVKLDTTTEGLAEQLWTRNQMATASYATPGLKNIAEKLAGKVPMLLEFLRAFSSGTKGGQVGKFVRMTPVLAAVRSLRQRSLQLNFEAPERSESPDVQAVIDLYRLIKHGLPVAIDGERQARNAWYQSVSRRLGEQNKIADVVAALRSLIEDVVGHGINTGSSRSQLNEILSDLKPNALETAIGHGAMIEAANNTETLVRTASIGESAATLLTLLERAESFIQAAEQNVESLHAQFSRQAGAGLAESEARIATALDGLIQAFDAVAKLPSTDHEPA